MNIIIALGSSAKKKRKTMNYKIDFNYGIGSALPVSLFVELKSEVDIFQVWDDIQEYNCRDIILYGNIKENVDALKFLNSCLVGNNFHVSTVVPFPAMPSVMTSSVVTFSEHKDLVMRRDLTELQGLRYEDTVVLTTNDVKIVNVVRSHFLKHRVKARIMSVLNIDLLDAKLYDVIPYFGEILNAY